jgi:hypothetical protein
MHGKIALTESNQALVSLFKELVLTQSMAVPVAAMNALVLKLKVICARYCLLSSIDLNSVLFLRTTGFESKHVDAAGKRTAPRH